MTIESIAYAAVFFVLGLVIRSYLPAYMSEKGKNLATKEDIAGITARIEGVKLDYSEKLESTKAQLSAQMKTHGFRYEKEYIVLDELTRLLVDVRDTALNLRPVLDVHEEGVTDADRKKKRLTLIYTAQRNLYQYSESKRPFYSAEIYDAIKELIKITRTEAIKYQHSSPFEMDGGESFLKYWESAENNQAEIERLSDAGLQSIRERVNKWEALS